MADQPTPAPAPQPSQNLHDLGTGLSSQQLLVDAQAAYQQHQQDVQAGKASNPS